MQASDIILGLLIILLVGWAIMISIQQQSFSLGLQALEAKQTAQGIQVSPERCSPVVGKALVKATGMGEGEYLTRVGFDNDLNQLYFCFYR